MNGEVMLDEHGHRVGLSVLVKTLEVSNDLGLLCV